MLVAGARPNFMKIASVLEAIHAANRNQALRPGRPPIEWFLVHTGQHYDGQMSGAFFRDLGLPQPDIDLGVGSASPAQQTAEIMKRFEPVLLQKRPEVVLLVGDVTSTLACALVASKTVYPGNAGVPFPGNHRVNRPLIAHVEAGLRSFDRSMPEEINRILTDALSDFLFITEETAQENLLKEGIPKDKIHFVGNTMIDTLLRHCQRAQHSGILQRLGLKNSPPNCRPSHRNPQSPIPPYAVLTLHRPSNVDHLETFQEILDALSAVAKEIPICFPVHPRTWNRIREFHLEGYFDFPTQLSTSLAQRDRIRCLEPCTYLDFLCLLSNARLVLTDSGGIQEEASVLGIPCLTLRDNTERPVTLTQGTNVLAGTKKAKILRCAFGQLRTPPQASRPKFWDGLAGERILQHLIRQIP